MSTDSPTRSAAAIDCGVCTTANPPGTQFCPGCGHSLFEPCGGCSKPVQYSQTFCGSCGHNLAKEIETKRAKYSQWMSEAVTMAKHHKYDDAIGLLSRIRGEKDYRFKDLADNARQAVEKVDSIAAQMKASVARAETAAESAIETEDHAKVVELLGSVPEVLLSPAAKRSLGLAQSLITQTTDLEQSCHDAINAKNWVASGPLLDQLIELYPKNDQYPKLARQVGQRLLAAAQKYCDQRRYAKSMKALRAVPAIVQSGGYYELRGRIENILWLREQFDSEPFDSPTLGRLAVRLAKEEPDDPENVKRVNKISANLKSGERCPRNGFPYRPLPNNSWLGGKIEFLRCPQSIAPIKIKGLELWSGRLNVAIGLALQGLEKARLDYNFIEKKGFLKSLGRRKSTLTWGIDIGSSAIKAIALQITADQIEIVDGFVHEFEEPLCRPLPGQPRDQALTEALAQINEQHSIGDSPVWVNFPATAAIARFSLLPPVGDKQAKLLLEREIATRIPMELDTMVIRSWTGDHEPDSTLGRAAMTVAVKKQTVQELQERIAGVGWNLAGIQAEQVALLNLAYHEFPEELAAESVDPFKRPTIAMLHAGAEASTCLLLSDRSHWFWTIEAGGEDLTSILARQLKLPRNEAEQLKRRPHALPSPAADYQPIEARLDDWRARFKNTFADGIKQDPSFHVTHCYVSGGVPYAHQWTRRTMMINTSDQ
ncbi:pilus assembly protein PilM [Stieleria sp. TO1_6]|uniref:pilus assembly protein PilM n=1 Tax=Stieleria tagensis TaxID=2956795 RepID=UPI00209AAF20|nr:pilus assembly protein PilM [Stieleria tagensis]MCO8121817.1 pilus assembly protein PilM [Stieleria tagensis]